MLLNKLKKKPYCNNFHIFLVNIILLMLSFKYNFIFIFLILYLIFIFLKFKKLILPLLIIAFIIISEILLINFFPKPKNELIAKVDKVENNGYIVNYNFYKIKILDTEFDFIPGDIIKLELDYQNIKEKSYETDFDYKEYLKSNKILYLAKARNSNKIKSGFSLNLLKYYYESYLEEKLDSNTFEYVKALVFADNDLTKDLKNSYSILGISHILAISGMHIIMLFNFIFLILKKIFRIYKPTVPLVFIIIYVLSIGAPPSALRAVLFLLIKSLNEKGEIKYTKLDILSISFILMIFSWPYIFYNSGFQLSFLVSFILIFSNELIKTNNKIIYLYLTFILIYFNTLPIISSFNNQISILSLLLSPILSLILGFIIIPISYIVTVFPFFDKIFLYFFKFLNIYVMNLANLNIKIPIMSFNIYLKLIYYIAIFLLIKSIIINKNKIKHFIFFSLFLLTIINLKLLNPLTKITFIDVGQGDSCLIELPFNKGNILIDSFNSIDFIKAEGITTIDYLILTHGDIDHTKEAVEVIDYFNVKNIILNNDSYSDEELKIINEAKKLNIKYMNKIDEIYIDKYTFKFLNTDLFNDENNNSNVIYTNIDGISLLFMGDAEKEKEEALMKKYKLNEIDILKVGHHGSNSSSTKEFVNLIKPKISIISVGENNKYGHPDNEVLNNLKNSQIYMTKDLGNIEIDIINNKYYIKPYKKSLIANKRLNII